MKKLLVISFFALLLLSCRDNMYLNHSRYSEDNVREYTKSICKKEVSGKMLPFYACMEANRILTGEVPSQPDGKYGNCTILHLSNTRFLINGVYDLETFGKDLYSEDNCWKVNNLEIRCTDVLSRSFNVRETSYESECDLTIDTDTDTLKVFLFCLDGVDPKPFGKYNSEIWASGTTYISHKRKNADEVYLESAVSFRDSCIFSALIYYDDEVIDYCLID